MSLFFRFLIGFSLICFFYFSGEMLVRVASIPLPGTLMGLLMLLAWQFFRRKTPMLLLAGGTPILKHMAMLFVPAVLGVGVYWQEISENITGIALAIIVSTAISLGISAWIAQKILQSVVVKDDS
ncbi:CidA/LrgA family protein [Alteromonas confluentis]|uniref:Murein hydrolase transporter LrgA n=1 Tax=Alteromonas confluentis TaxID=1656094 RepID=A0A1E7Z6B1_9ALTE|nr:CidA/LrgA family protein [Alteromonas confluentis]OFC69068.1 hypothetical protein BFC18_20245 [Alteromonas confluentis]